MPVMRRLAAAAALLGLTLAVAAPPAAAATTTRLWAAVSTSKDIVPTTAEALDWADRFDVLSIQSGQIPVDVIDAMKARNPRLEIFVYQKASYLVTDTPDAYPHDWFSLGPGGEYLTSSIARATAYLMDPSSAGWRAYRSDTCATAVADNHADGCFLDTLGATAWIRTEYPATHGGVPWTRATWLEAAHGLALQMQDAGGGQAVVNSMGKPSSYFDPDVPWKGMAANIKYASTELFPKGPFQSLPDADDWADWMRMLESRRFLVITKGLASDDPERLKRFSLASFLLGSGPGDAFSWTDQVGPTASIADDDPLYHLPIGAPLAARRDVGNGLWARDFEHGIAVVNPTDGPLDLPLAGTYRTIDGAIVTGSLTVAPKTGEILVDAAAPAATGVAP